MNRNLEDNVKKIHLHNKIILKLEVRAHGSMRKKERKKWVNTNLDSKEEVSTNSKESNTNLKGMNYHEESSNQANMKVKGLNIKLALAKIEEVTLPPMKDSTFILIK
jgi:sucrose-6-phosphate hydrolase SacC (GH32 family)